MSSRRRLNKRSLQVCYLIQIHPPLRFPERKRTSPCFEALKSPVKRKRGPPKVKKPDEACSADKIEVEPAGEGNDAQVELPTASAAAKKQRKPSKKRNTGTVDEVAAVSEEHQEQAMAAEPSSAELSEAQLKKIEHLRY